MTPAPDTRPDYEDDRNFATALARGLSVLRAFRTDDDGLSNAQIAERTGLPKSTVSRLTYTLGCLGYLTQPHIVHGANALTPRVNPRPVKITSRRRILKEQCQRLALVYPELRNRIRINDLLRPNLIRIFIQMQIV